jgi:hypothetical protein
MPQNRNPAISRNDVGADPRGSPAEQTGLPISRRIDNNGQLPLPEEIPQYPATLVGADPRGSPAEQTGLPISRRIDNNG